MPGDIFERIMARSNMFGRNLARQIDNPPIDLPKSSSKATDPSSQKICNLISEFAKDCDQSALETLVDQKPYLVSKFHENLLETKEDGES